ncbi:MAG: hypothetical protein OEY10_00395 [Nitrosopumilus sp.]|nr:hypothetical protein [Nitrosopumilus sp.]
MMEDCEDTWNETVTGGVALSTTTGMDINGGSAVRATTTTVGATTILMSEVVSLNLTAYHAVSFWIRSSVNTSAGDLRFQIDDTGSLASPLEDLLIPALTANVWKHCVLRLSDPSLLGSVISIGLYQQTDLADGTFDVDSVYALAETAGIGTWSIDYTVDAADTTDFQSDGVSEFIAGVSQWSGSFSGQKEGAPLSIGSIQYLALSEKYTTDTTLWSGQAVITGLAASTDKGSPVTYDYSFQGTGPLEQPTA